MLILNKPPPVRGPRSVGDRGAAWIASSVSLIALSSSMKRFSKRSNEFRMHLNEFRTTLERLSDSMNDLRTTIGRPLVPSSAHCARSSPLCATQNGSFDSKSEVFASRIEFHVSNIEPPAKWDAFSASWSRPSATIVRFFDAVDDSWNARIEFLALLNSIHRVLSRFIARKNPLNEPSTGSYEPGDGVIASGIAFVAP